VNINLKSRYKIKLDENWYELKILTMAMEHTSDSIIVTDRQNRIIKANHAFLQTFGYTEDEILGKNPHMLSSITQESHLNLEIWETLLRKKQWSGEIWNTRKNGEIFSAWVRISTITNEKHKIQNYLTVFTDLSALRTSQKKSLKLAFYDQLTGLPNRQKIVSDMQKRNPTACIIFNVDDFKEINDFFGIETGDIVLKQIGQWFERMNFFPYRIGGDEFAVLFHNNITWNDLRNRIIALMSLLEEKVFLVDEEMITIQMTVGAAIGNNKLLTRADIALNHAKKSKKTIALYAEHENVEEIYCANMRMSAAIRQALANRQIVCHYQPIVNFKTGAIDKYETLVRMIDHEGMIVPPALFLTIAKKTKLYPHITIEVVNQACNLFASRDEEFSINLSDSDIRDQRIVKEIINTILKTGTGPRIVFEILESEGIENYEEVAEFITKVKTLGAKIAIDDFGTGYSNFENIIKLNVDYIKIDGSLIQGIAENPRHRIVVETITDFAHKIHAKTIAEFVGSQETYTILKEIGIDFSQGYFTGKPGPLS
jgi:diguanylate cyclase (GGDEF)-like protein/PAS domain S-box-containing protein